MPEEKRDQRKPETEKAERETHPSPAVGDHPVAVGQPQPENDPADEKKQAEALAQRQADVLGQLTNLDALLSGKTPALARGGDSAEPQPGGALVAVIREMAYRMTGNAA